MNNDDNVRIVGGETWYRYSVDFDLRGEGRFSAFLWARSDRQAAIMVQALRKSARLGRRVWARVDA